LTRNQVLALAVAFVLIGGGIIAAVVASGGGGGKASTKTTVAAAAQREVFAEPVSSAQSPFSPPVGSDNATLPAVHPQGNATTQVGGQIGLYGGTMQRQSCDKTQLVTYLEGNPEKAAAWASVVGIQTTQISSYVGSLTAVLLRSDTRVTNHGYVNGHATSIQSVLQAGTAVLVDDRGVPVTKCYCGNPLTPPVEYPPVYYGPKWTGFDPNSLTVIVQNTTVVNVFTLVDPATGQAFTRPAGTDGSQDAPLNPPSTSTTTTTTTTTLPLAPSTTSTTSTTTAGPTDEQRAIAKLERLGQQCYPFRDIPQDTLKSYSSQPGPDSSSFIFTRVGALPDGSTQTFVWQVDRQTLVFTPLNELARRGNNDCAGFGEPGP
jgi:hypothetical protein